jgi:hypothetical protein
MAGLDRMCWKTGGEAKAQLSGAKGFFAYPHEKNSSRGKDSSEGGL